MEMLRPGSPEWNEVEEAMMRVIERMRKGESKEEAMLAEGFEYPTLEDVRSWIAEGVLTSGL